MHDVWLHPTDKTSLILFLFTTMATRYSTLTLCNYLRIISAVGEHTLYREKGIRELGREGGVRERGREGSEREEGGVRERREGSEREEGGEKETRREEGKEVVCITFLFTT